MIEKGDLINQRYRIIDSLGEGGMANVYLAEDTILERLVAVKLLRLDLQHDPATVRRFQREARAITELSHPNIVAVYDVQDDGDLQYLVMEYVPGPNLKTFIQEHYPLPYNQVVDLMRQILAAVAVAHRHGIIHRDLKPQNILVTPDNQIKIADFGIAVALNDSSATQTTSLLGSVHYISPEQVRGSLATPQSDIYSLGIILFEMLTNRVPFSGESAVTIALKHFNETMPSVREIDSYIPQPLENVILHATAKNPADRYATVIDMATDLDTSLDPQRDQERPFVPTKHDLDLDETKVLSELQHNPQLKDESLAPPSPSPQPNKTVVETPPKTNKKMKKRWWLLIVVGLVAILAIALAVTYSQTNQTVVVPDLHGMTLKQARNMLIESQLKPGKIQYTEDDQVAKNLVVMSLPKADNRVKLNSDIILVLSRGNHRVKLGDYVGDAYSTTKTKLERKGFKVKRVLVASADVMAGDIIEQSLAPGRQVVAKKTTLTLTVSSGPAPLALKDLTGMTEDQVREYAQANQFMVNIERSYSATVNQGMVISQTPTPGSLLSSGDQLSVVISKGEDPKEVKSVTKTFKIEYQAKNEVSSSSDSSESSSSSSSSSSTSLTPNQITIYIGDATHQISQVYDSFTITADTTKSITFQVVGNQAASYKIQRDGQTIATGEVKP